MFSDKILLLLLLLLSIHLQAAPATPTAPRASLPGLYIDLTWSQVAGASYYLVEPYRGGLPTGQVNVGKTTLYQLNVVPGQQYQFLVKACDATGCSAYSPASNLVNVPVVPAKPAAPLLSLPGLYLDLTWSPVTAASYYLVEPYINTLPTGQLNVGNTTLYQRNVTLGYSYQFLIKACNTSGCSAYSTASNVVTVPQVPATPQAPVATLKESYLDLSWSAIALASYYLVEPYQNGTATGQQKVGNITTYRHNVTAGNSYQFLIKACNSSGCSAYSPASNIISVTSPPARPTVPQVKLLGTEIELSWLAVTTSSYYKALPYENGVATAEVVLGNVTSYRHATQPGRNYHFLLKACNTAGCSVASPASATITAPAGITVPGIPTTLSLSAAAVELQLSWLQVDAATSYQFELFENDISLGTQNAGDTHQVKRSGSVGKSYRFRVKACNSAGCSAFSIFSNSIVLNSSNYVASTRLIGDGTITPSEATVAAGQKAVFTLTAASGRTLLSVSGCNGTRSAGQYTTAAMYNDCQVIAEFSSANQDKVIYLHTDLTGSVVAESYQDATLKTTDYKPFGESKDQ